MTHEKNNERQPNNEADYYLESIYKVYEEGRLAKEVACSLTTGFRLIPSMQTNPGLNPYHASVADIGYGYDAVQGTIDRIRAGEDIPYCKELLAFDISTLGISKHQIFPNFDLAVVGSTSDTAPLVDESYRLNEEIIIEIDKALMLAVELFGPEWDKIVNNIKGIQGVSRL